MNQAQLEPRNHVDNTATDDLGALQTRRLRGHRLLRVSVATLPTAVPGASAGRTGPRIRPNESDQLGACQGFGRL